MADRSRPAVVRRLQQTLIPPRIAMWGYVRQQLRRGEVELRLLHTFVPRDRIAIDVGANRGVYTHVLSKLTPHIESFEPNPELFRMLRSALPGNARAHAVALSDRAGEADLLIPYHGVTPDQRASLVPSKGQLPVKRVRVPTRTLDSHDFRNVGFMKIDVEGFEQEVLRGARETLERERPVLLVEMEERHTGMPIEESLACVAALGYDLHFARGTRIYPIAAFDPEVDHRSGPYTGHYINNFIALPIGA